jgi:hypothetical protein
MLIKRTTDMPPSMLLPLVLTQPSLMLAPGRLEPGCARVSEDHGQDHDSNLSWEVEGSVGGAEGEG